MSDLSFSPLPPEKLKRRKHRFLRFLGFAFTAGVFLFLAGSAVAAYFLWQISQDLPDYERLAKYEPAVMTRVHGNDGSLIGECAAEQRVHVPIAAVPQRVINAFIAAEDQNFYRHSGIDLQGIARAVFKAIKKEIVGSRRRSEGASTITQQVAKNFLLTNERKISRKVKEMILAIRIERAYSKERILELYLNEIYFGLRSYGIAAAALAYFDKELKDITIEEAAYLAALPKGPNNYHPVSKKKTALARRNWVIDRMAQEGFVTRDEAEAAKQKPLGYHPRHLGASRCATDFFSEEVRRTLKDLYGDKKLMGGGLSVRSTLDPRIQKLARQALREGLLRFDRSKGYRGPVKRIGTDGDWGAVLAKIPALPIQGGSRVDARNNLAPWRLGVVLEATKDKAVVGLQPGLDSIGKTEKARTTVELSWKTVRWARRAAGAKRRAKKAKSIPEILSVGDVIYVAPQIDKGKKKKKGKDGDSAAEAKMWRLVQIPKIEGAMVVMDPHSGRVLAIVGGFSYVESQFDRAAQAKRQPGSSFKPIVYAAALDNGYTPSSIVLDAPFSLDQGEGKTWSPENYENKFYGPSTLRLGLEKSRNLMTVRLAQDLGMPIVGEYARRFGVYEEMPPLLSMALGAGETTLLRMVTAYCTFVNGGKKVTPTLIDRIQDRRGKTIWRHDVVTCPDCRNEEWNGQDEPALKDNRAQIIDPFTAYQMVSMLEGVVKRGTGYRVSKVGKPLAGKTGTSNDEKDAWFVGFSPDLVAGVYIGYDQPKPMGRGKTGGSTAAPVFRDFMRWELANKPATPFRAPSGIKLVRIDAKTGMRAQPGTRERTILEAYKPSEDPPDSFSYVTYPGFVSEGQSTGPDAGVGIGRGFVRKPEAGGLY